MLKKFLLYNQVIKMRLRSVIIILLLTFFASIVEAFGIGIFYPIFQYIKSKENLSILASDSDLWAKMIEIFNFLDLEISLIVLLTIAFLFFFTRQITLYTRALYQARLSSYLQKTIRYKVFSKYLKVELSHQEALSSGGLTNIMINEIPHAVSAITIPINFLIYIIMLIVYIIMLLFISIEMTFFSMFIFMLASRIPQGWIGKSKIVSNELVDINARVSTFIVSRFRSPRLVRLSGSEVSEKRFFLNLVNKLHYRNVTASILANRTEMIMEPIVVTMSLFFLYVAYAFLSMSIEIIGLYLIVSIRLLPIVKGLVESYQRLNAALGSLDIVKNRINDMDKLSEKNYGVLEFSKRFKKIIFKNVSYHYPDCNIKALNSISFEINSGEITAIVGPSGGGKSTLIDLLPRLRLPQEGQIFLDSKNINEFEINNFRSRISYIPQSPQIFEGSIKDHVKYGNLDISEDQIREACKLAGASEFIEKLPNGYDSLIGDSAVKLSGGQRQRVDLARALAGNFNILILDEPTSSLDKESTVEFNSILLSIRAKKDKTIIIVSHDLSAISNSDKIIVIRDGGVESIGTHNSLLNGDNWYSKAYNGQPR